MWDEVAELISSISRGIRLKMMWAAKIAAANSVKRAVFSERHKIEERGSANPPHLGEQRHTKRRYGTSASGGNRLTINKQPAIAGKNEKLLIFTGL